MTAASSERHFTGRMALWTAISFFGVIIAVNMALVYFALSTWPGLVSQHAYEEGVHYNRTLAAADRQKALGWISHAGATASGTVTVRITDHIGKPVAGLTVSARAERPTYPGADHKLTFTERASGVYRATQPIPAGAWRVEVTAVSGDGKRYFEIHEFAVGP